LLFLLRPLSKPCSTYPGPHQPSQIGITHFEVRPSTFEETLPKSAFSGGAAYAAATARAKAAEVAAAIADEVRASALPALIIAADTVVERGGGVGGGGGDAILEKPDDDAHAVAMLTSLSGGTHAVHTGVTLAVVGGPDGTSLHLPGAEFTETTAVTFARLTPGEIAAYVSTGEAAGKAGAYGIQGSAAAWVERVEGCYFNVVGLPLHALSRELSALVEVGLLRPRPPY
jgi:septum formation protein